MHRAWWVGLILLAILAGACRGNNSPTVGDCLVGTWILSSPEAYLRALLPPKAFDPGALNYKGSAGSLAYTFTKDGRINIQALQFLGRFDVKTQEELMALDMAMGGTASGEYSRDGDKIKVERVIKSDLPYTATLDGESMVDNFRADFFAPLFMPPYTTAQFQCSGDILSLQILNLPGVAQPITFQRYLKPTEPSP